MSFGFVLFYFIFCYKFVYKAQNGVFVRLGYRAQGWEGWEGPSEPKDSSLTLLFSFRIICTPRLSHFQETFLFLRDLQLLFAWSLVQKNKSETMKSEEFPVTFKKPVNLYNFTFQGNKTKCCSVLPLKLLGSLSTEP